MKKPHKLSIYINIHRTVIGFNFLRWGLGYSRGVKIATFKFGPFFTFQDGLPFSREAAGKVFRKLNQPGSSTRALADLYRKNG